MSPVLERNIQALARRRRREDADASFEARVADKITRFTGSMLFVYIHLLLFRFWAVANLGLIPAVPRWDETFVILGTSAYGTWTIARKLMATRRLKVGRAS